MLTVARTTFRDIEEEATGCDITLPIEDYLDMIGALSAEHCRVFAARIDGQVVAWSIVTVEGSYAVRYYAAMRDAAMRIHVTDRLRCMPNAGLAGYHRLRFDGYRLRLRAIAQGSERIQDQVHRDNHTGDPGP